MEVTPRTAKCPNPITPLRFPAPKASLPQHGAGHSSHEHPGHPRQVVEFVGDEEGEDLVRLLDLAVA